MVIEPKLKDSCVICEMIFTEVYIKLQDNATVERIEEVLEGVCSYLPSDYVNTVCSSTYFKFDID